MNVLFLSELIYPHGSGAEFSTYRWAQLLAESGCKVKILTHRFPGELPRTELGNLTIFRRELLSLRSSMKYSMLVRLDVLVSNLLRRLLSWADIVYIPRFWYSAIPIAKAYRKRVITHLHDYQPICSLATMYDLSRNTICGPHFLCNPKCLVAFERNLGRGWKTTFMSSMLNSIAWRGVGKLAALSDSLICVSKAQLEIISRHSVAIRNRCSVVHNPLPDRPEIEKTGEDFGYFGGPSILKGVNLLLQALEQTNQPITLHADEIQRKGRNNYGFRHTIQNCAL